MKNHKYRLGEYNVQKGRSAKRVLREVKRLMRTQRLDALNLLEVNTQLDYLLKHLPDHLHLVCFPEADVAARDSAIVVNMNLAEKKGNRVFQERLHDMGGIGWERAPENRHHGLHNERKGVSVRLGPLRLLADHFPPPPHSWRLRGLAHRVMTAEMVELLQSFNRGKRALAGAWVTFGDKNKGARTRWAKRLAKKTCATRHGSKIDWLLAGPNVQVKKIKRLKSKFYRADHKPVIAVVVVEG